jgi:hypothetical protein
MAAVIAKLDAALLGGRNTALNHAAWTLQRSTNVLFAAA